MKFTMKSKTKVPASIEGGNVLRALWFGVLANAQPSDHGQELAAAVMLCFCVGRSQLGRLPIN
jgi:hypothetical protein